MGRMRPRKKRLRSRGHGRKPGPAPGSLRKRDDSDTVTLDWLKTWLSRPLRPVGKDQPQSWSPRRVTK